MLQSAQTSPNDLLFSSSRPSGSSVRRTAVSADKKLRQGIFAAVLALFRNRFIRNLPFGIASCKLLLDSVVGVSVNYRIVMVGHKIHRTFAVIFHNFVSDTAGGKRFLKERVAYILFVL